MVLGIHSHTVVIPAARHGILRHHGIGRRIDHGDLVRVAQVYVDLLGGRIVLRHARLTRELERRDDPIRVHTQYGHRFPVGIHDVDFPKRGSIGAAIRLGGGRQHAHNDHLAKINHPDLLFTPVRGVCLVKRGYIFNAGDTGQTGDCLYECVGSHIDHVQNSRAQMGRQEIVILIIHRQVIEPLALRARDINDPDLSQALAGAASRKARQAQEDEGNPAHEARFLVSDLGP